jgi:hypothetical protein
VLVVAEMAAAVAVVAAMATVAMVATTRQPWQWRQQRGSHGSGDGSANMAPTVARGRPMWVEVIFCTYYYLHDSRYRCDNNCQVYGKTQKCFDSKHKSVLSESVLQNSLVFCKTLLCFHPVGHVC